MAALTGETTATETTTTAGTEQTTTAPPAETTTTGDWRSGLTGDHASLAQDKTLANIKGKDWQEAGPTLAKMLVESQKVIGKKTEGMIKLPGKDAKPEEIAAYREAIGVPKAPSDYKITVPADAPEGTQIDPKRFEHFVKGFHELGITNEQMQGIAELSMREDAQRRRAIAEQTAQDFDAMADEWGVDVFNRRSGDVQALVRRYADPEAIKAMEALERGEFKPELYKGLFKMLFPIAREFVESGVIEPVGASVDSDIKSLEQRLNANREAYLKAPESGPQRGQLLDERQRLLNQMQEMMPSQR